MPAFTTVPSGQVTVVGGGGGGGGGGGHGVAAGIVVPSGQTWVAGVVAHAESAAVAANVNKIRLIFSPFHVISDRQRKSWACVPTVKNLRRCRYGNVTYFTVQSPSTRLLGCDILTEV